VATEREIIGTSSALRAAVAQAERAGRTDETVLLLGESGSGKELLARRVHAVSARAKGPFVAVNCGALPEELVESTLFGHHKGAFTGAVVAQKGKFELAQGGTLFLDEVGEMTAAVQVKLLRALQERVIEPLGSSAPREIDLRVVAATNRDLAAMVGRGQFRQDLYFRLEVLTVQVPPLRERREDIPLLVRHFLRPRAGAVAREIEIEDEGLRLMTTYGWPGNVRELENFVKKASLAAEGPRITVREIARLIADAERNARRASNPDSPTSNDSHTRPAATTTLNLPGGSSGLALAWWRFELLRGENRQPYACTLGELQEGEPIAVELPGSRARVGRERGQVEVPLETREVSRLHAIITAGDQGFSIDDAHSRNGTFVDGRALGHGIRVPLQTGTVIRIGKEWLGIAVCTGEGVSSGELAPVILARAFLRAGGEASTPIDVRALELLCAGHLPSVALEALGRRLAERKGCELIDETLARAALPERNPRPAALSMTLEELVAVVDSFGGNKRRAARELGISHTTLHERLKNRR
jgi:transcriptional regulator with GAF, ATPase, and Fis domain